MVHHIFKGLEASATGVSMAYEEHKTDECIRQQVNVEIAGRQDIVILSAVERRKLS